MEASAALSGAARLPVVFALVHLPRANTMADARETERIRFFHSLAGRLLTFGVLPATLLLGSLLAWGAFDKFDNMRTIGEERLLRHANIAAGNVQTSNKRAMELAESIAHQQVAALFGKRALSVAVNTAMLVADENVTAAYACYEPNADNNDAAALTAGDPKEWMELSGRFIAYPFRDWRKADAISVKQLVDYETSLYYDGVRRDFAQSGIARTIVTEPYVYDGQLIVEAAYPIVIDGKFKGVGATDRALAKIEAQVRESAYASGAVAYLISGRGRFVVASTDSAIGSAQVLGAVEDLRTTTVKGSRLEWLVQPLIAEATEEGVYKLAEDPKSHTRYFAAAVKIPAGDWTLVFTKAETEVLAAASTAAWRTGLIFLLAISVAVGLIAWIAVQTGARLRSAARAAQHIAAGDLRTVVPSSNTRDEAGVLLRSLDLMQRNLNALMMAVKGAGVTLDSSALELTATSREQQHLSQSFGESTSQIAAATRQISATGTELSRTMSEVDKAVERTSHVANDSRSGLIAVDGTMRELQSATASIATKLSAISDRASAINTVVTTIAKVADQTNLLSVNAAIEAEKAGEQGRGFLVVAREIRRLADQTAGATVDIEEMVREMQSAVGAGVMEMDRFSEKVRRGVDEVVRTSRQMGEIIEQVAANSVRFGTVSVGMQSQSEGATSISESMSSLVDAAKRTVESAEEFGKTATELQHASITLRENMQVFTLKE